MKVVFFGVPDLDLKEQRGTLITEFLCEAPKETGSKVYDYWCKTFPAKKKGEKEKKCEIYNYYGGPVNPNITENLGIIFLCVQAFENLEQTIHQINTEYQRLCGIFGDKLKESYIPIVIMNSSNFTRKDFNTRIQRLLNRVMLEVYCPSVSKGYCKEKAHLQTVLEISADIPETYRSLYWILNQYNELGYASSLRKPDLLRLNYCHWEEPGQFSTYSYLPHPPLVQFRGLMRIPLFKLPEPGTCCLNITSESITPSYSTSTTAAITPYPSTPGWDVVERGIHYPSITRSTTPQSTIPTRAYFTEAAEAALRVAQEPEIFCENCGRGNAQNKTCSHIVCPVCWMLVERKCKICVEWGITSRPGSTL